jgi:hypothetical protein
MKELKKPKWVSISERMPTSNFKSILVKYWDGRIKEATYKFSKKEGPTFKRIAYTSKSKYKDLKVSYWLEGYE